MLARPDQENPTGDGEVAVQIARRFGEFDARLAARLLRCVARPDNREFYEAGSCS